MMHGAESPPERFLPIGPPRLHRRLPGWLDLKSGSKTPALQENQAIAQDQLSRVFVDDSNRPTLRRSNIFHDLDLALLAKNFDGRAAIVAADEEVDGGVGELEIFDLQVVETIRKERIRKADLVFGSGHVHS